MNFTVVRAEEDVSSLMLSIEPVARGGCLVDAARELFAGYREFLETIESTHCFDFARYNDEIRTLPAAYTDAHGELLLALVDGVAAGCIAFRAAAKEPATTCEIKRLFVLPEFRGQGIARALIGESLKRAAEHGFERAILDTDVVSMPTAYATYVAFGFEEYKPDSGPNPPSLRYLGRSL
jgi:GNAT superfamily N-acetyltransferase